MSRNFFIFAHSSAVMSSSSSFAASSYLELLAASMDRALTKGVIYYNVVASVVASIEGSEVTDLAIIICTLDHSVRRTPPYLHIELQHATLRLRPTHLLLSFQVNLLPFSRRLRLDSRVRKLPFGEARSVIPLHR